MARPAGERGRLTEPVLVKLTPDQAEELEAAALIQGVSSPELLRTALDEFLVTRRGALEPVIRSVRQARQAMGRSG